MAELLIYGLMGLIALLVVALVVALSQIVLPLPAIAAPKDVFGFANLTPLENDPSLPELKPYRARDGSVLAYRFYYSTSERLLVFIHGSSYHGAGYHTLAAAISRGGFAKVLLPNLRGHYMSGRRRGDVDYVGQLEDDVADLIEFVRSQGVRGSLILGGHSSGGGLAIRFAGGAHEHLAAAYLLLSPLIPLAATMKSDTAGGWAFLHKRRLFGLLVLNALGISGFNGLPIIQFNKPEVYWDGTETLSYSYRLNTSYHPRYNYQRDLAATGKNVLVLVGENDEANDAAAYRGVFAESGSAAKVVILPGLNHFEVFSNEAAFVAIEKWLRELPV